MKIVASGFDVVGGAAGELRRSISRATSDAEFQAESAVRAATDPDAWSTAGHVALVACIFVAAIIFLLCALVFFRRK
ncbi:MAG: hypothetical protein ABW189_07750 [Rickettsiales bacterium]